MTVFLLLLVFIAVACGLVWYFLAHDKGEPEPVGALWLAMGFGFGGGFAAVALERWLLAAHYSAIGSLGTIFISAMAVGVIEEASKFIPLAFFIYPRRYFNEYSDGIIYFAIAGLGFGLPENILYTVQFGAKAGLYRVVLTPLFHAALTGMVGYYLIRAKLRGQSQAKTGLVLLLAMVLHGLYDFGLTAGRPSLELLSLAITLGLSATLFVLFAKASQLDETARAAVPAYAPLDVAPVTVNPASVAAVSPTGFAVTSPVVASEAIAPVPEPGQPSGSLPAILAVVFGLTGFAGILIPIVGLVFGMAGLVLGSLSRHSARRGLSTAGLIVSAVALLASLGSWIHYNQTTATVRTPCYNATFSSQLTIHNNKGSCALNAYNGTSLGASSSAYKVLASRTAAVTADNFEQVTRSGIEKDIARSFPGYTITTETAGDFAGRPAYFVNAANASGGAMIEAAVMNTSSHGENFFVIVHTARGGQTDLSDLSANWKWK